MAADLGSTCCFPKLKTTTRTREDVSKETVTIKFMMKQVSFRFEYSISFISSGL